ncbi:MAG: hypothetical protein KBS81_02050 [Spirochaetales bacterium]|nr:hypothetical protein [Candidatus Physcosoma equi]
MTLFHSVVLECAAVWFKLGFVIPKNLVIHKFEIVLPSIVIIDFILDVMPITILIPPFNARISLITVINNSIERSFIRRELVTVDIRIIVF